MAADRTRLQTPRTPVLWRRYTRSYHHSGSSYVFCLPRLRAPCVFVPRCASGRYCFLLARIFFFFTNDFYRFRVRSFCNAEFLLRIDDQLASDKLYHFYFYISLSLSVAMFSLPLCVGSKHRRAKPNTRKENNENFG